MFFNIGNCRGGATYVFVISRNRIQTIPAFWTGEIAEQIVSQNRTDLTIYNIAKQQNNIGIDLFKHTR